MNTWKVILATLVIFGSGVFTGGLLVGNADRFHAPRWSRAGTSHASNVRPSAGGLRLEFLRRLEKELALDEKQREQVNQILKASQERTRELMEPVAPQLREELERAKAEFRKVLRPEQQSRFDELLKHQQRSKEMRKQAPSRERPTTD